MKKSAIFVWEKCVALFGSLWSVWTLHIASLFIPQTSLIVQISRINVLRLSINILIDQQVRIQDLVKGGAPGAEAESCRRSEVESCERSEQFAAGVQGPLKGPGSFWVFNAQICILLHSRDSFSLILASSSTSKADKKVHYIVLQSIWDIFMLLHPLQICIFYIFMKWKSYAFDCLT